MSRLEVPFQHRTLWVTGDILLKARLDLWLRDNQNGLQLATFLVDSGTEMTTMPASVARSLDLPLPRGAVPGFMQHGQEVRSGVLRAQVDGMDGTEYYFPCSCLGDPDVPLDPNLPATVRNNLLGLSGVVDKIRLTFDGKPTSAGLHGNFVVEKQ